MTDGDSNRLSSNQRYRLFTMGLVAATVVVCLLICIPLAMILQPEVSIGITAALSVSGTLALTTAVGFTGWGITGRANSRLAGRQRELSGENHRLRATLQQRNMEQPMLEGTEEES